MLDSRTVVVRRFIKCLVRLTKQQGQQRKLKEFENLLKSKVEQRFLRLKGLWCAINATRKVTLQFGQAGVVKEYVYFMLISRNPLSVELQL